MAPVKRSGSEPTSATNDGADAGPLAPTEDTAEERSGPCSNRGVNNAGSTSAARLDRAFDVYFLPRRRIVKLNQLSVDGYAASIWHNQPIEAQHHCRVALQSARRCDVADVSVDPSVAVVASINDGCAERIANPGVGAG